MARCPFLFIPLLLLVLINFPPSLAWILKRDDVLLAYSPNELTKDETNIIGENELCSAHNLPFNDFLGGAPDVPFALDIFRKMLSGFDVSDDHGTLQHPIGVERLPSPFLCSLNRAYCGQVCPQNILACVSSVTCTREPSGNCMSCCMDDFQYTCVNDWKEVEEMFPTTTTITTTQTPAPVKPTVTKFWVESIRGGKRKKATRKFTCKRGRKTIFDYNVGGGNECMDEANQCYFIFCHDVKMTNRDFAEWGCVDKSSYEEQYKLIKQPEHKCDHLEKQEACRFCDAMVLNVWAKQGIKCCCFIGAENVMMSNEHHTFEANFHALQNHQLFGCVHEH
ncbi:hypothetical protein niasHS_011940 [Heterodera schachtii]|uniref:Uncharacterized protein n=1 Tax=Heterodera schachtii TaxID=97005 RepID=A0ABD2IU48_HETSC